MSDEESARALVNAARAKKGLSTIGKAVTLLLEAHRSRKQVSVKDLPLHNDEEAYRIQDSVFDKLWPGARPVGWKAGGPSDKVEPTASPISAEKLLRGPATVAAATMSMLGVEAEVAFRLKDNLPPRDKPYKDKEVAAAVGEVLVAIELCDTRLEDWKDTSGIWKLADFQNNSALVVGTGVADWQRIDFEHQEVEFTIGKRVSRAKGGHSFGNPFRLMPWIANHCAKRGAGLHAGDVVTTGAWTGLEIAQPGDEVVARFPGIGEARLKFT
jgi:2-keto-4-pentenoate hydratase